MKNKEIEELLNELKNTADTSFFAVCGSEEELKKMPRGVCNFLTLNDKKAKLLLSYIEQLEKKYNRSLDKLRNLRVENEQLENNRDKAIELLNELSNLYDDNYTVSDKTKDIIDKLKGDSDE